MVPAVGIIIAGVIIFFSNQRCHHSVKSIAFTVHKVIYSITPIFYQ